MSSTTKHEVVETSTARFPSDNGWMYYYCRTCPDLPSICAARFDSPAGFDDDGWRAAAEAFDAAHPHTEVIESHWAQ
jgi:hypothetical protein